MSIFPKIVHVLDIETEKIKKTKGEIKQTYLFENTPKIYFAGLKTYKLLKDKYIKGNYQYFLPHEFKKLETILKNTSGIIIGHYLFDFDYRVLSKYINLNSFIERTVDTCYFLYKKNGEKFGGINLDDLAKINLNKQKTFDGGRVEKEWKKGNRKKVIKYNENDCKLTFELYEQMIFKGYINYRSCHALEFFPSDTKIYLKISEKDGRLLTGKKRMLSLAKWEFLLKNNRALMPFKKYSPVEIETFNVIKQVHAVRRYFLKTIKYDVRVVGDKRSPIGGLRIEPLSRGGKWLRTDNLRTFLKNSEGICHLFFCQNKNIITHRNGPYRREGEVHITRSQLSKALERGLKVTFFRRAFYYRN